MHGALVHYYIAAYDANNKVLTAKGSSGSPNVLELGAAGPPRHDAEDPVAGDRADAPVDHGSRGARADVVERGTAVARGSKLVAAVSFGTGVGYVSGKTEGENTVQKCCLGTSPFVVTPELRYNLSPRMSLGLVARLGFPIGANIAGHSTLAPAGFVRLGYALSDSGGGFHLMAEAGFGILRNTITLSTEDPTMDTDIVAQGPMLLGAGVGYTYWLGNHFALLLDLDAIAGIAVVDKLGTAIHLNTGVSGDMWAGFALGF